MGLSEDLAAMRQQMGHGPEHRPGERTVSLSEDLANMKKSMQSGTTGTEETTRFPIGATAFGIGAGIATSGLGVIPAMGAAMLASGVGEGIQQGVEQFFDLPTKASTPEESLGRLGKEMVFGSLGEGTGRVGIKALEKGKLLFFTGREVSPEARQAMQFLQGRTDLPLLPAQATESRGIDLLHNIAEHSFFGGGRISQFRAGQQKLVEQMGEEMIDRMAPSLTPEQAGELLVRSADKNLRISRAPAQILYNSVKESLKPETGSGLKTSMKAIRDFVQPKAVVRERLQGIGDEVTGGNLYDRILSIGDTAYVSDLIELRTMIRGIKEGKQATLGTQKDPAIGMLKGLEGKINDQIELSLRRNQPMLWAAWKQANVIYREGSEQFNNKVIRQLGRMMDIERTGAPERVVKSVFAPQALTRMQAVKAAVSPEAWKKIARQGMELTIEKSKVKGQLDGAKLLDQLIGRTGLGQRGLVEAVGPIEAQNWIALAKAAKVQQAKQASGEGSMFIQLSQPGAVVKAAGAALATTGLVQDNVEMTSGGALILSLPFIASRIMTNPTAAKALIDGMQTNTKRAISTGAGILTRLTQALVPRKVEVAPASAPPIPERAAGTRHGPIALMR